MDGESSGEEFDGGVVVGQIPTVSVPRHIKKRSLKNKALSVSFNEKDLKDFVTGFHKRKKKRRKEAQRQLKEKERLKRIEARKRRKAEKELALFGGASENPPSGSEAEDAHSNDEKEELNPRISVLDTKTYESGNTTVTVTTSELGREEDDLRPTFSIPKQSSIEKSHSLSAKKKPLKRVRKQKSQMKPKNSASRKKDKRKGKHKQ